MKTILFSLFCLFFSTLISYAQQESKIRIALGSCNDQTLPQTMWETILQTHPELWIWMGDNIYADLREMRELKKKYVQENNLADYLPLFVAHTQKSYQLQKNQPAYQKLLKTCPVLGVWDDHDFGENNEGKYFFAKKESQQLLLDFLGEAPDSPRRHQEGVYTSATYGPLGQQIKIILLDVRYHRENPGETSDTLGETQWKWLEKELSESKAQLHFIVSGIQVLPDQHPFEKWSNFPTARKRLFQLIQRCQTPGVLFLSGDRHTAEISKFPQNSQNPQNPVSYPLYELTASGLTHSWKDFKEEEYPNRYLLDHVFTDLHFGLIEISWEHQPPHLTLQIRDIHNRVQLFEKIKFSTLMPLK
jgi:alkaline phosphatase D